MDLFGKKTASLESRLQAASEEIESCRRELDRGKQRHEAAVEARKALEEEAGRLKARIAEAELARDKAREAQAKAEQMVRWLEGRHAQAVEAGERAARERDEALARASAAAPEADGLRREVEALKSQLALAAERTERERERAEKAAARAAARAAETPREAPPAADPALGAEVDALRRDLAEQTERLRIAVRKAEHNRRAYLVTQMQLDLAEDRIHLLTKGTPRPVHIDRDVEDDGSPVEAVDVEDDGGPEEIGPGPGAPAGGGE